MLGKSLIVELQYRERLRAVIVLQLEAEENQPKLHLDDVPQISKERLSLWALRELAAQLSPRSTSEEPRPLVYNGPPRVLEIGCGDGAWCFKVKKEQPDWIVEGIDDTDHVCILLRGVEGCANNGGLQQWRCVHNDVQLKVSDYFAQWSHLFAATDTLYQGFHGSRNICYKWTKRSRLLQQGTLHTRNARVYCPKHQLLDFTPRPNSS